MTRPNLPRHSLGQLPTPILEMPRLTKHLGGPRLLIKRDDQTGLALGGNKTRKLEFLMGDALATGHDVVLTAGAMQSNHCRQTAAAAAACGVPCHLALSGHPPDTLNGNALLDDLLGAHIHWCGEQRKGEQLPEIARRLRENGARPYTIPYGGSNALGVAAFVYAAEELKDQLTAMGQRVTHIVLPTSSGGTLAGLILGTRMYGLDCRIIGIQVDKEEIATGLNDRLHALIQETVELLGVDTDPNPARIEIHTDDAAAGYGVMTDRERSAIQTLARTEGILLDPVYTGRAMAGLIRMTELGDFTPEDTVLFWHTGGTPALFSYAAEL